MSLLLLLCKKDTCIASATAINIERSGSRYSSLRSSCCTSVASSEDDLYGQGELLQDKDKDKDKDDSDSFQMYQSDDSNSIQMEEQAANLDQLMLTDRENINLSSTVWFCTKQGYVAILNFQDKTGQCQNKFRVCTSPLLSIAAVPGYIVGEYSNKDDLHCQQLDTAKLTQKLIQSSGEIHNQDNQSLLLSPSLDKASRLQQPCMWLGSESGW